LQGQIAGNVRTNSKNKRIVLFFIKNDKQINYEHALADIIEHIYAYTNTFGLTIYQQYPEQ